MAKPWRWISTDIGIAADLPSLYPRTADWPANDLAGGGRLKAEPEGVPGGRLFCDWIKLRGAGAPRRR